MTMIKEKTLANINHTNEYSIWFLFHTHKKTNKEADCIFWVPISDGFPTYKGVDVIIVAGNVNHVATPVDI